MSIRKIVISLIMFASLLALPIGEAGTVFAASVYVHKVYDLEVDFETSSIAEVSWDDVYGATGYQIYRKTGKSGTWTLIEDTIYDSCYINGIKDGKIYYFKVRAYNDSGTKTVYGKYSSIVKYRGAAPAKIKKLKLANSKSSGGIKISWGKVSEADGYKIYRKTSGTKWRCIKVIASEDTTSYVNTGLASGKKYSYKVRAYNEESGCVYYGKYSKVKKMKYTGNSGKKTGTVLIGLAKAKKIAINHAGFSTSEVTFIKAECDYDDGVRVYEVEFLVGQYEYEYEINAYTGTIIGYDIDYD